MGTLVDGLKQLCLQSDAAESERPICCMQALSKLQFTPPPPFQQACAMYLVKRLESFLATPPGQSHTLDASVVLRYLSALVGFKLDPPAHLLELVRCCTTA